MINIQYLGLKEWILTKCPGLIILGKSEQYKLNDAKSMMTKPSFLTMKGFCRI